MNKVGGFLAAAVGLALGVGSFSAGVAAQEPDVAGPKLNWDISLWGKKRAFTAGLEKLAELVSAKTAGNWTITLHYGEALSKSRENLDGLSIGAFQGAMFCNFYHPRKNPALMVLTMPFLPMGDWDTNRRVRDAVYGHSAVKKELARWNALAYVSSYLPQYELLGRGAPPLKLADWKGKTVRAGGGLGQAMKVIGATPTSSTATEVYTGVQQGTMDAASFPFTYSHAAHKIHEVSDWFTGNLSPGTADCPVVFSLSDHNSLPDAYKQLLEDVRDDVVAAQIQAYIDIDKVNLPMLKERLTEITYGPDELEAFRQAAGKPVIDAWIKQNQNRFDARGLVEMIFETAGQSYN